MPRYKFTGWFETALHGLSHGVNAHLHFWDPETGAEVDHGQPEGSTVLASPGAEVETTEPYPHSQMVNVDTGQTDVPAAAAELVEPVEPVEISATSPLPPQPPSAGQPDQDHPSTEPVIPVVPEQEQS